MLLSSVRFAFDVMSFMSVMVLIVMGLGVIASMMGIFNFAHGEFVLLGAYTLYLAEASGLPAWWGIILAPIVVGLIGLLLEQAIIRRFYAAPIIAMLGTYAIGLVIRESVRGLLGGHYKSVSEPWPGFFAIAGLDFSSWRAFIIGTTVVVVGGSWLFLTRTPAGLRIRGSLENPMLARACGISTAGSMRSPSPSAPHWRGWRARSSFRFISCRLTSDCASWCKASSPSCLAASAASKGRSRVRPRSAFSPRACPGLSSPFLRIRWYS
jgi:branched-subunit amino acid ABC-type transport system permease component